MSFMADKISRILRTRFGSNVDMAMQELHACFLDDGPIQVTSPIIIIQQGNQPPITYNMHSADGTNPLDTQVIRIVGPLTPEAELPEGVTPLSPPAAGGGGNAYAGTVLSGSGSSYICDIAGSTGPLGAVSVTMPGLAADAAMASGTPLVVVKVGAAYLGFPSVFSEFQ